MKRRVLGLVLVVVLALVAWRTIVSTQRELVVTEVCGAASERRWEEALDESLTLAGDDDAAHSALECRCLALLMTGDRPRCLSLLERAVGRDEEWLPDALLTSLLLDDWLARGDAQRALALASAAGQVYPEDPQILAREVDARALHGDAEAAFDAVAVRVGPDASLEMRLELTVRALKYELGNRALAMIGATPPPGDHVERNHWYLLRGRALAALGRSTEVNALMDRWRTAGMSDANVLAFHALILHEQQLWDASPSIHELVAAALEKKDELDPWLLREAYGLQLALISLEPSRREEALALLKEVRARYDDFPIEERDILMSDQAGLEVGVDPNAPRGEVAFVAPPAIGGVVRVAPDLDASVDSLYEQVRVGPGERVAVRRVVGRWPVRWVFVDDEGRTRASGGVWPVDGGTVTVNIEARAPSSTETYTPSQAAADGRRRVFLVILDSADWRLVTYLLERGELPVLSAMYRGGIRAVLDSNPAFTAAAMKSLTRPDEPSALTVPIAMHGLGEQLATFFQIGENPVEALSLIVPDKPDLFEVLSAHDVVVANMLHGHGGLNAGVHGAVYGPGEKRGELTLSPGRQLNDDERERFPGLLTPPRDFLQAEVSDTAAQFDDAVRLAREKEVDLLLLRVPATDHATHATFSSAARGRQDDGDHFLYWLYRYCDARLGELYEALDEDDVLIVASDHGVSSHMAHDRRSLFLVDGGWLPSGRAPYIVPLYGLPRMLADLLRVETDWHRSGLERWVKQVERRRGDDERAP